MAQDEIAEQISAFIRDRFLDGDPQGELEETTPLLELGVLNSLNTVVLLAHIREELGVAVPSLRINPSDLKSVRSIAAMVRELQHSAV
ncbi:MULTISPECIES: acyl carrier protein [Streptomyces]|jgi:acyl carrier protein|uniref:Proline carrier protein n=2 Tax=Streptomyces chartreusis TaxID=1969 RepID=F8QZR5_STRCX|nr:MULTISPECIES: acyl carrier protein [Streptomyces]AEH42485.1 proline carrier protein [Streptomyces chartreusis NRRL 3882]MYS91679.1 acyl carrier protein [Streptomyces sp. SID5464]SOR83531.1 Phosphopantetheine attachment site [Streptomyces chartreusis NRRL 3882]